MSAFTGYKQVEAFGSDEEYEDGVEECYVTLDMGVVDPTLLPSSSTYRLIGLDTATPFLQLSGTIFKGKHETMLGTELIFTDDDEDRSRRHVRHVANTENRIRFREVELKEKKSTEVVEENEGVGDDGTEGVGGGRGRGRGRGKSQGKGKGKDTDASTMN